MLWLSLTLSALAGYSGAVATMATFQRRLLYRPVAKPSDPEAAGTPWMHPIREGNRLLGWYSPPPAAGAPVLVFFHGNRGTLGRVAQKIAPWRALGLGLFAATYRGYEGNAGRPSEAGLYDDGRATMAWLLEQGIGPERVILYGESLGSGVAAQMAVERPVRALVLEAPFASISDVAAGRYPWAPARLLVRDRFDTLLKIPRVAAPTLILHGDADRTIPVDHAHRLASARPSHTRLVIIAGAGHVDLHQSGGTEALATFVATLAEINGPT